LPTGGVEKKAVRGSGWPRRLDATATIRKVGMETLDAGRWDRLPWIAGLRSSEDVYLGVEFFALFIQQLLGAGGEGGKEKQDAGAPSGGEPRDRGAGGDGWQAGESALRGGGGREETCFRRGGEGRGGGIVLRYEGGERICVRVRRRRDREIGYLLMGCGNLGARLAVRMVASAFTPGTVHTYTLASWYKVEIWASRLLERCPQDCWTTV